MPVINENDAVTHGAGPGESDGHGRVTRPRVIFSDNDRLAALLAAKCRADLLVLLTDVDGVYERDPRRHPGARLLDRVDDPRTVLDGIDDAPGSAVSRGGMRSKVEAARIAARGGCCAVIASGHDARALSRVLAGDAVGTWFPAVDRLGARRGWIAYAAASRGALHLDAGAVAALREGRASLLSVGVVSVDGSFSAGDVIELRGPDGKLVGRGRIQWSADTVRRWLAGEPPEPRPNCLLRRDHVVLEP